MYVKSFWETVTLLFENLELRFWVILNSPGLNNDYSFSSKEHILKSSLKILSCLIFFLIFVCH